MNAATARDFRRADFAGIDLYSPDTSRVHIDLGDNTNRWGMCPAAQEAIRAAAGCSARYPQPYADSLKRAIAAYVGVPADHVVTGCGSDDVLDSAIRAFGEPGATLALADPSFEMVAQFARMNGLATKAVPLAASYDVDVDALLGCDPPPRIAYLCSPNNPTGTLASRSRIETLAELVQGVLMIDEAYAEYTGSSCADLAASAPNVLVVRTFSKAFGLAGLRVGYAIGAPALVREVEKSRGPYKVSAIGAAAAVAALGDGLGWMRQHVAIANRNRERLAAELRARCIDVAESAANFVFAPMRDARGVAARMRDLGVRVRAFSGLTPASQALARTHGDALRISVGPWDEVQAALDALDRVTRS
jgi:histidinol-phosphate aminotransferase